MRPDSGLHATITLFAALNLLDIASTHLGLQTGLSEANGIPSLLLSSGGEPAMYLVKGLVSLAVIAAVIRLSPCFRRLQYGMQAANGILTLTVLQNMVRVLTS